MRPKNIYILRHGLSMGNIDRIVHDTTPDWKIDISTIGELQSYVAANKILEDTLKWDTLPNFAVYLSPYVRTRQTWAAMKTRFARLREDYKCFVRFEREDPRLREQEWSWKNGLSLELIEEQREEYGPFYYRIPGGESGCDVYDRCSMFLDTIYRDFEREDFPENVVIVTHGFTMRILVMRWIHATVEEFHTWKNPENCRVVKLIRYDEKHYCVYDGFETNKNKP